MSAGDRAFEKAVDLGAALDAFDAQAKKRLRPDQYRAFAGTLRKMLSTYERMGAQLGFLIHQYEKFTTPPPGPAPVHRLSQYSQRRRKRPR